jgi:hypothetical protein
MGAIQDTEVLLGSLQAFAQKHAEPSEAIVGEVLQALIEQRAVLVENFMSSVDTVVSFWPLDRGETAYRSSGRRRQAVWVAFTGYSPSPTQCSEDEDNTSIIENCARRSLSR